MLTQELSPSEIVRHSLRSFLLKEHRKCLRHSDKRNTAANGEHDSFLDILVTILHLKIHIERTDKDDDGGNGLHKIADGGLVGTDL